MQFLEGRLTERRTVVMKCAFGTQTVAAVYQTTNHQVPVMWENNLNVTPGVTTLARLVVPQDLAPGTYQVQPRNGGVACYYSRESVTRFGSVDIRASGQQARQLWVSLGQQQCLRVIFTRASRATYLFRVAERFGPEVSFEAPLGMSGARILYTAVRPVWVTVSVTVEQAAQAFADFTSGVYVTPLISPTAVLAFGRPWAVPPTGLHRVSDALPVRAMLINQHVTIQPASARAQGIPVVQQELTPRFLTTGRTDVHRQRLTVLPLTLHLTGPQLSEVVCFNSVSYPGRCDFVPILAEDTQMQRVAFPAGVNANPVVIITQELAFTYARQATSPLIELVLEAHPPDAACGPLESPGTGEV